MAILTSDTSSPGSASTLRVGWEWTEVIRSADTDPTGPTVTLRLEGGGQKHAVPEGTTVSLCGRNLMQVDFDMNWGPVGERCEQCVQLERTTADTMVTGR